MWHNLRPTVLFCAFAFCFSIASFAHAQDQAAVIPTKGVLSAEESRAITIEVRYQLRNHGYSLAVQKDVREAAKTSVPNPTVQVLRTVANKVDAQLILAPSVARNNRGLRLEIVGFDLNRGVHRGYYAELKKTTPGPFERVHVKPAVASCVSAFLGKQPTASIGALPVATQMDLSGISVAPPKPSTRPKPPAPKKGEAQIDEPGPPVTEPVGPREVEQMPEPEEEDIFEKFDHAGIFMDLGFILSYAYGDTLARNADVGFGGRMRLGYRIKSIIALSISGSVSVHEVPRSVDAQEILSADRMFLWAGVYGGIRYHPVKKFILDPFIGIDMGWTWMVHLSQQPMDPSDSIPEDLPEGAEDYLPSGSEDLLTKRTNLTMQGFTIVPQAGLRLFFSPRFAIGVVVEWSLPFWSQVCARVTEPTVDGLVDEGERCTSIAKSGKLSDFLGGIDLSEKSKLPKFLNAEFDISFLF